VVSVDPGGSPAGSRKGAPTALRPRLAASLPLAPKHWQIHHLPYIGRCAGSLIPEIWATYCEKWRNWIGRPAELPEKR